MYPEKKGPPLTRDPQGRRYRLHGAGTHGRKREHREAFLERLWPLGGSTQRCFVVVSPSFGGISPPFAAHSRPALRQHDIARAGKHGIG